jgi:hypothetical protein
MIGSWLYQPALSGVTAGLKPGLVKYQASVLGLVREGSGYDIAGRSFDLKIDGTTYSIPFVGSGLLSLATVISTINTAVGSTVAKNENGFLRIESPTVGESSFVGIYTDPASSPKDVLYKLGLFSGMESRGGEPTEAPMVDWYKQRIPYRQLAWSEGESISSSAFNRSIFQLAWNLDRNHGFLEHKRLAGLKEVSVVMNGTDTSFDLADSVFTGLVGPSPLPDADDLENVVSFLDSDYGEVVVREFVNDGAATTGVYSPTASSGGEGIQFVASGSVFSASDATQDKYLVGTHANLGTLSGAPLKIIEYVSGTTVRVSNVDSNGAVVTITTTPSISVQKKVLTPWTVRVDGLYDVSSPSDRVEKVQKTKVASTTISRIDLNNRVVCSGASFTSAGLLAGDLVTISGHSTSTPYSNNGSYRVKSVIDDETLELLGSDWSSVFLNTTGTLGALVIKTDGDFFYNVRVHLDKAPPAGTYTVLYKTMSTLRGILDSDVGALAAAQLRSQEEVDDTLERAILAIIGPSATSISSYLYNDARYSLERAYGLITAEHYAYDESDRPGRHRNVYADSVRIGNLGSNTPSDLLVVQGSDEYQAVVSKGLAIHGCWNGSSNQPAKLTLRSGAGASPWIYFSEDGVGERGVLGYLPGSGDLQYRRGASTMSNGSETLRITSLGKVSIGDPPLASPSAQLHSQSLTTGVKGDTLSAGGVGVHGVDLSLGVGYGVRGESTLGYGVYGQSSSGQGVYAISGSGYGVYSTSNTGVGGYFSSSNSYALITGSGNVGIGTAAPAAKLHIVTEGSANNTIISGASNDPTSSTTFVTFRRSKGTLASPTNVASGDSLGGLAFQGSYGGSMYPGAWIFALVDGGTGAGDMPARLAFYTSRDGEASPTERMRIAANGYVGIGYSDTPSILLTLKSAVQNQGLSLRNDTNEIAKLYGIDSVNESGALELRSGGDIKVSLLGDNREFAVNSYIDSTSVGDGSYFSACRSRSGGAISSSDTIGGLAIRGKYDASSYASGAVVSGVATEGWTSSARGCELRFYTVSNATTALVRRMTIGNDGYVVLNPSSPVGVYCESSTTDTDAVGIKVRLTGTSGSPTYQYAVYGEVASPSTTCAAIKGTVGSLSAARGVWGENLNTGNVNAKGVYGYVAAYHSSAAGVEGVADNASGGIGVAGYGNGGTGVYGYSAAASVSDSYGVYGKSNGKVGVYGHQSNSSSGGVGVLGYNEGTGCGGYFSCASTGAAALYVSNADAAGVAIKVASGRVAIGSITPSYSLELASDSAGKPSTNTWTITASDERVKDEIEVADYELCLSNFRELDLKRWSWKVGIDGLSEEFIPDRKKLGWIAQDVEKIFPKSVNSRPAYGLTDCKGLNTDQVYAMLYGALKAVLAKVDALEKRLDAVPQQ